MSDLDEPSKVASIGYFFPYDTIIRSIWSVFLEEISRTGKVLKAGKVVIWFLMSDLGETYIKQDIFLK